ncbi:MAG: hypothetical protein VKK80_08230 [Prochlorothrix sp.]|nr:hypothetical protein [Prochlorothrix sp.]
MTPKAALLKANIDADLAEIEKIYEFLAHYYTIDTLEQAILAGYYLNNLYSAFENICLNIAQTFENQIDDRSRWHAALLKRMTLDIESIRPKLLSPATYTALDELRRFRHIFRNAYTLELDPQRLQLVLYHAQQLQQYYPADLAQFKAFLNSF